MSKTIRTALAVICVLVIALCLILVLQKTVRGVRVDLTQEKIYTLSAGTRHILGQLNQPVTLKLYYSRTAAMKGPDAIRFFNSYYLYVRDLLEEYSKLSAGKLKLEVIDPRRYSDAEEDATQAGLKHFAQPGVDGIWNWPKLARLRRLMTDGPNRGIGFRHPPLEAGDGQFQPAAPRQHLGIKFWKS